MRRDGDPAGVARASAARWLLRILIATVVVGVGLALAATSAQADVKRTPLGTTAGKLTSGTATKAKVKVAVRATAPKVKSRVTAKAAPVRRVAKKAAPVRTYRVARTTRTVVRKAAPVRSYRATKATRSVVRKVARKAAPVRTRISTVQRKTSPRPTVRTVRNATAPKARPSQRAKASPTKINSSPSKIIKSSVRKAAPAKRSPSTDAAKVVQTGAVNVTAQVAERTRPSAEVAVTVPAVQVAGQPVVGTGVPAVVTPEIKVRVGESLDLSAPPVGLRIPLLSLPGVTLPRTDLPAVAIPGTDLPTVPWPRADLPTVTLPRPDPAALGPPGSEVVPVVPMSQVHQRADPVGDQTSARQAPLGTATPQRTVIGPSSAVLIATLILSSDAWTIASIGQPALGFLDDVGERIRAMDVPTLVGTSAALIIAAAVGAAATGAVGSGSAGGVGLAVVPAIFGLSALGGYGRLDGRLRESAFGTPRRPGYSPD